MANESSITVGTMSFALGIGMLFPFNWCIIYYYNSHPHHLALAWTYFQHVTFFVTAYAIMMAHHCFMCLWRENRANRPQKSIGWLIKIVVDVMNIVIAPVMLHRIGTDQLNWLTNPSFGCGLYLHGWWFLMALICFTATYHAWTHVLKVARGFDVAMDIVIGSGMQFVVYSAARRNNYGVPLAVLGFYGGFQWCCYLFYSRTSPSLVVADSTKHDLEEALSPPSVLP